MLAVALAIAVCTAMGFGAERRDGARAQRAAARAITVLLWGVLPFVTFFTLARLEVDAGVGIGLLLAYTELAIVGVLAYLAGTRLLRLDAASTGALVLVTMLANTGYLGIPLVGALLGSGALGAAIAFDTVVSGPMFFVVGFAIGAAFGTRAGDTRRRRVRAFFVRNPALAALVASQLAPDVLAPDVLVDAAKVLAYAVLPVGFFILGVNLAAEAEGGVLGFPPRLDAAVGTALVLRLVVAPLLMLGLVRVTVDVPDAYLVQAAMPSGINSLIVAHAYGLDLRLISAALAWSTGLVIAAALVLAAV